MIQIINRYADMPSLPELSSVSAFVVQTTQPRSRV